MITERNQFSRATEMNGKVSRVFQKRSTLAVEHFTKRTRTAFNQHFSNLAANPMLAWDWLGGSYAYAVDCGQRSILFWDTLRQRGNRFLEHERAGKPPVLHFDYEVVQDARKFKRPVNYALLRIVPPKGVAVDAKRRPYIIIDPRAGHGPGIGGFKDDSQIGVALRDGHPVYFVSFFANPEHGQTILDVTAAEEQFVHKVRQLHPHSPKPVLVGNCQGGWAAMMLAVSASDETGPVVINGAPMSYWGGAWREGEGDNPMRYAAGLLGGAWLASLTADLGNGVFDGAWLVQNFENLNPANTFWEKYYNLFASVDTEPPRFLEFERWWGGFYLMNREEIEWITSNLFVGNKLWSGDVRSKGGRAFDLREIKSPIVLFASLGDNITPPQQAFNWIADVYDSTDEIKARGQVIVGLMHEDIGHLGIFVSGRVAKREHTQIVSVLKSIEALAPGLYGMKVVERKRPDGKTEYDVEFQERRLEDIRERLNRFKRADEKPFEAVEQVADFNQRAYELFARPLVRAVSNESTARFARAIHPLRARSWACSDLNPWLTWLGPMAAAVKANRRALGADAFPRQLEGFMSEVVSASLEFYREIRDAASEALFYQVYGNLFSFSLANRDAALEREREEQAESGRARLKQQTRDSVVMGGYPEAVARVFALLARSGGEHFPLAQLHLKRELMEKFGDLLPDMPPEQRRRVRGTQDLVVKYDGDSALRALPQLLRNRSERDRLRTLLERVMADEGMRQLKVTPEQLTMLQRIREVLSDARGGRHRTLKGNLKPSRPPAHSRALQPQS